MCNFILTFNKRAHFTLLSPDCYHRHHVATYLLQAFIIWFLTKNSCSMIGLVKRGTLYMETNWSKANECTNHGNYHHQTVKSGNWEISHWKMKKNDEEEKKIDKNRMKDGFRLSNKLSSVRFCVAIYFEHCLLDHNFLCGCMQWDIDRRQHR